MAAVDSYYYTATDGENIISLPFTPASSRNVAVFAEDEEVSFVYNAGNDSVIFSVDEAVEVSIYHYAAIDFKRVKAHLRMYEVFEPDALALYVNASVAVVEERTGYTMTEQTISQVLNTQVINNCSEQLSFWKPTITNVERYDVATESWLAATTNDYRIVEEKPYMFHAKRHDQFRVTYTTTVEAPIQCTQAALIKTATYFDNRTSTVKRLNDTADALMNQVKLSLL